MNYWSKEKTKIIVGLLVLLSFLLLPINSRAKDNEQKNYLSLEEFADVAIGNETFDKVEIYYHRWGKNTAPLTILRHRGLYDYKVTMQECISTFYKFGNYLKNNKNQLSKSTKNEKRPEDYRLGLFVYKQNGDEVFRILIERFGEMTINDQCYKADPNVISFIIEQLPPEAQEDFNREMTESWCIRNR